MEWHKIDTRLADSHAFALATSEQLGGWLRLILYCGHAENLGVIHDCRDWTESQWLRITRVSAKDIEGSVAIGFASWHGKDLRVAHYDVDGQRKCESNRRVSHIGGKRSVESRGLNHTTNHMVNHPLQHIHTDIHRSVPNGTTKQIGDSVADFISQRAADPDAPNVSSLAPLKVG